MTPRQPPRRERQAAQEPVLDQRLSCVFGARRRESTLGWQQRRDEPLIADDGGGREPAERAHASLGPGIAARACRI